MRRALGCSLSLLLGACSSFAGTSDVVDAGRGEGSPDAADGGHAADADAAAPADPALLGHWKFDEATGTVASDALGKNPGTLIPPATWSAGHAGGALDTRGGGHVEVPNHPSLTIGSAFTVAMWVALDDSASDRFLYVHGYTLYVKINGLQPQLSVKSESAVARYRLPPAQWHHLAATFDAGTAKFYVDGYPAALDAHEFTPATTLTPDSSSILIGSGRDSRNGATGLLDDVRLYGRALTETEIALIAK